MQGCVFVIVVTELLLMVAEFWLPFLRSPYVSIDHGMGCNDVRDVTNHLYAQPITAFTNN